MAAPEGEVGVRTYHEHQQLITLIHELSNLLDAQSRTLLKLGRGHGLGKKLPPDCALHETWPRLQQAFQLLSQHALSIQAELQRLTRP